MIFVVDITPLCLVEPMVAFDTIQLFWSSLNMEFISTNSSDVLPTMWILLLRRMLGFCSVRSKSIRIFGVGVGDFLCVWELSSGSKNLGPLGHRFYRSSTGHWGLQCHPRCMRGWVEVLLFTPLRSTFVPVEATGFYLSILMELSSLGWDPGMFKANSIGLSLDSCLEVWDSASCTLAAFRSSPSFEVFKDCSRVDENSNLTGRPIGRLGSNVQTGPVQVVSKILRRPGVAARIVSTTSLVSSGEMWRMRLLDLCQSPDKKVFGVRQVIHFLPFIRYCQDFWRYLSRMVSRGSLPISSQELLFPTHLLYADGVLMFCEGLIGIDRRAPRFWRTSNQGSLLYLSRFPFKGSPTAILRPITDRILERLASWKGRTSDGGRLCLINSVITSSLSTRLWSTNGAKPFIIASSIGLGGLSYYFEAIWIMGFTCGSLRVDNRGCPLSSCYKTRRFMGPAHLGNPLIRWQLEPSDEFHIAFPLVLGIEKVAILMDPDESLAPFSRAIQCRDIYLHLSTGGPCGLDTLGSVLFLRLSLFAASSRRIPTDDVLIRRESKAFSSLLDLPCAAIWDCLGVAGIDWLLPIRGRYVREGYGGLIKHSVFNLGRILLVLSRYLRLEISVGIIFGWSVTPLMSPICSFVEEVVTWVYKARRVNALVIFPKIQPGFSHLRGRKYGRMLFKIRFFTLSDGGGLPDSCTRMHYRNVNGFANYRFRK
ncbi:hypothetical protein FNV43_RR04290 [Rhamnella rubrinervis]|uniref:Uncharacterized protein n=1 Tax=Rhamnella rubrinervis TaxID=2594499 RepID=A0A8K0HKE7_9ROSA|nr:hypothetical protein FNV43_RR04290 [Rhamnella rubrinervis]